MPRSRKTKDREKAGAHAPAVPRSEPPQPAGAPPQAEPENEGLHLAARAALLLGERTSKQGWKDDPWRWYQERAMLLDPLAPAGEQIAPYPDFPYLRAYTHELEASRRSITWKSRRMIASWTGILRAVRLCELYDNMRCFFIAKKEGETDAQGVRELIWRAGWAASNLRGKPVNVEVGKLHVYFPDTKSSITGVTSEPNVMRQVSANFVMGDELAFWPFPRESLAALLPTLEQRGTFMGLSSSADGFFKEMVTGAVEDSDAPPDPWAHAIVGRGVILPAHLRNPEWADIPGFSAWTNKNGRIISMHYTADPRKRSAEWREKEKAGIAHSTWLQEYEMQFGLRAGRPVFLHEWRPERMIVDRLPVERSRPVFVSLDFGHHRPTMTVGQMRYGLQMCILRTYQGSRMQFEDYFLQCLQFLREWFPRRDPRNAADFIWCCDRMAESERPSGIPEKQIMLRHGIHARSKYLLIPPTVDLVRGFMSRTFRGQPCFLVEQNPSNTLLINALDGGYHYPEGGNPEKLDIPVKDGVHDDVVDTVRYAAYHFGPNKHSRAEIHTAASNDIIEPGRYVY